MSNNESNDISSDKISENSSNGLLREILGSPKIESGSMKNVDLLSDSFIDEIETPISDSQLGVTHEIIEKPKKKPLNTSDFLRIVGAIFLVALIFFGGFLAYIVTNPGQASFFIAFGINPGDIARLLKQLVSAIFGIVTFVLSIVWIIYLFRAILTKKEYKKKKTISIILATFFGILLFAEITVWATLVNRINATDYENPNGGVLVYDNEKFISERFKNSAQMSNFDNLIGPIELKFDLKADANTVGKIIDISSYKINFDGAKCLPTGSSNIDGVNAQDNSIICTFDEAKVFKPTGIYEGINRVTHKPESIPINFHAIQIVGIVDIKKTETSLTYDASHLTSLGNLHWLVEEGDNLVSKEIDPIFSIVKKLENQILCLNVSSGTTCDKLFIVPIKSDENIIAKIVHEQDVDNPSKYLFHLGDKVIKTGEIVSYKWIIGNHMVSTDETFDYVFPSNYGNIKIKVVLTDSAGKTTEISDNFPISYPLKLIRGLHNESLLHITDTSGKSMIDNTYNPSIKAYYITGVSTPTDIEFNATDIKVENLGYELTNVAWDFNGDGTFEKVGMQQKYELVEEKRYTFQVRYTFIDKEKDITAIIVEKIIFESVKKDITIILKLTQDSEYAPTIVHVDGSASIPKKGTITKFIYDFGEGKGIIEGDAVQDYSYTFPGEYLITLTVVRDDGIKEQSSRKIILKAISKNIIINTSVSSGMVGKSIDFDTKGTIGQIESYHWDFGDGDTSEESNPTHKYLKSGKFTIKITVTYTDRTTKSTDKEIIIIE